jgi:hypothetical protein
MFVDAYAIVAIMTREPGEQPSYHMKCLYKATGPESVTQPEEVDRIYVKI